MKFDLTDIEITQFPLLTQEGMTVGDIPRGVRIVHKPTGCAVECYHHRSQYKNRQLALIVLELLVEEL